MKNILEYLEKSRDRFPDKLAFADTKNEASFAEFTASSQHIGCGIGKVVQETNKPIVIFIDRGLDCLEAMMGVLYSGNFYTVLDVKSPAERIRIILDTLNPVALITDTKGKEKCVDLLTDADILLLNIEALRNEDIDINYLLSTRQKMIDTDPMYVLFTSGSTGVPKGAVVSHRAVINYTKWVVETFDIGEKTVWGSQTPFYFSMSITDIFSTIMTGASFYTIPKMYFSFPVTLLNYLNEKDINTIYWVPSALSIVANMDALSAVTPSSLEKILFAGEVMPTKQLNIWRAHVPNALYANLFGPTETTDICTYYIVDRNFDNTESLPIGKACNNCDVFLLNEREKLAADGEEGELCVRGSFLAMGYYNNPTQTAKSFVQNPINSVYPEIIYRTGDIARYNENGELIYLSRKDFQIKHMGYRIELGEIEAAINNIEGIISSACIYDMDKQSIILFYQGEYEEEFIRREAAKRVPVYMCPNQIIRLKQMIYNANGKIDRVGLKKMYKGE